MNNIVKFLGVIALSFIIISCNSSADDFNMLTQESVAGFFHFDTAVGDSGVAKYLCLAIESGYYLLGSQSICS